MFRWDGKVKHDFLPFIGIFMVNVLIGRLAFLECSIL
jgi:hypothetical protein